MKQRFQRFLLLAIVLLLLVGSLTACVSLEGSELAEQDAVVLMDAVMANDFDAAYALYAEVASKEQFAPVWDEICDICKGSTTYEQKLTGWMTNSINGTKSFSAVCEVTTDTGAVLELSMKYGNRMNRTSLYVTDITPKTGAGVTVIRALLVLLSIAGFALQIWMIVDCAKRKIKHKALWIILTLISTSISIVISTSGGFNFNWKVGLYFIVGSLVANASVTSVNISMPLGAIIYFFARKKLPAPTDAPTNAPTDAPTNAPTNAPTDAVNNTPTDAPVAIDASNAQNDLDMSMDVDVSMTWDASIETPVDPSTDGTPTENT